MDGLMVMLDGHAVGERVKLTEVRARTSRRVPRRRVAEVLADLDLLDDDTTPAIRTWIDRSTNELPDGFARDVRAWLLLLLDGDARARPRAETSIYVYFGSVRPFLEHWAATHDRLREVTRADVTDELEPLRGHQRRNIITALRSLFRFAKKRGIVFSNPAPATAAAPSWSRSCVDSQRPMSSLTVPIPPDLSPACRAENTGPGTVPLEQATEH